MNHLVTALIVLYAAAAYCEATLFSWGSSSAEVKETKPNGYLPILQVHKYNGIQINPIQGAPVYLPNESNNLEGQTTQLSQDQIQQLDLINRLATFLPAEDNLQEMDLTAALPYVDLISEDSLESFKNTIEVAQPKEKSKLLKIIGFLKLIKEKKLKPFKYVASVGSDIINKKKSWLGFGSTPTTTPEPYVETTPITYPAYNLPYNSYPLPQKPLLTTYTTSGSSPASLPSLSQYPQQYPSYSYNTQQNIFPQKHASLPSADSFPPSYPSLTQQKQPIAIPAEPLSPPRLFPQLPRYPPTYHYSSALPQPHYQFQYPSLSVPAGNPATNEISYGYKLPTASLYPLKGANAFHQFATSNQSELPSLPSAQPHYQFQYPSLPVPAGNPATNEISYGYKLPTASLYPLKDANAIHQFATSNQSELPSLPSAQPQYQYQYPSLSTPAADLAKNEITFDYTQTPASASLLKDTNSVRQFAINSQSELPSSLPAQTQYQFQYPSLSTPAADLAKNEITYEYQQTPVSIKPEQLYEQQYSYQSNHLPNYNQNSFYVSSYPNSYQEPNKFYTTSPNDLAAAGSENVEKVEEKVKPESSLKNDQDSSKVNDSVMSSTETSVVKTQHVSQKRTVLRAVGPSTRTAVHPVYPSLPKEENSKVSDNGNKSSSVATEPSTN